MPKKLSVNLPSRGLTVDRPGEFVDAQAAVNIQNMEFNRNIVRKRLGTAALGAALGERIQRAFELNIGGTTRLVRVGLTKVQDYNKTTNVWADAYHALLTGAVDNQVSWTTTLIGGVQYAIFTNGVDPIRKISISGPDADLGGTPPKAKFCQQYGPYPFLAGITDSGNLFPSRVQWPDTGAPESWAAGPASNAGSVDLLDDPDPITGLGLFGSFMTVHKPQCVYLGQLITASGVIAFTRKATGVGAVSHNTIQNIPSGEQIFLASDGIHLFNGYTAPLIPSPVQDELREGMNPTYAYKAQSVFVRELDEYWVCVPMGSDTEPQTVYKYNWRTGQIYKDKRPNLTALALFLNTNEDSWDNDTGSWDSDTTRWDSVINMSLNPLVFLGDSAGVCVKRSGNAVDDNGVAVEAVWDTKDFTAADLLADPDDDRLVRWTGINIWAKGTQVQVLYSTDGGVTWTPTAMQVLTSDYPAGPIAPYRMDFDTVSARLRLRFYCAAAGQSFTLEKYQVKGTPKGPAK